MKLRAQDSLDCLKQRKMNEQSTADPLKQMTSTVDITDQATTGSDMTSSSSRGTDFYFQCAVVVIGVIGTAANAFIIYALVTSKQQKKHILIINQNALDMFACVFLVVTYSVKLCNIYLTGTSGHWLCATILSEMFVWWGNLGSRIGLAIITIYRYLKVVHPTWSKKWLRKWMTNSAMLLSWIIPLIYSASVNFTTTAVIDGVCYAAVIWQNQAVKTAHGIFNFMFFYVTILTIIIYCYARILVVIRRQASVMAGHSQGGPNIAQTLSSQIQTNVIKTMILVSAFYAVTNFPVDFYFLLVNVNADVTLLEGGYYATVFIVFLYSCANPLIYITQFQPVKETLRSLIRRQTSVMPSSQNPAAS